MTLLNKTRGVAVLGAPLAFAVLLTALSLLVFNNRKQIEHYLTDVEEVPISSATLAVRDLGEGSPAVIIITGMACVMNDYTDLHKSLANYARVISYDRPGLGDSQENLNPKTLPYIHQDLNALLDTLQVKPPYILIGHSLGGHIIRYFANKRPQAVAGLVFLDHPHEDWLPYIKNTWPAEESAEYFKFWSENNASYRGARQRELLAYEENCDLVRGMQIDKNMPVLMFTGNNTPHFRQSAAGLQQDQKKWVQLQASLVSGLTQLEHVVDLETGHWPQMDKPDLISAKIVAFIQRVRAAQK